MSLSAYRRRPNRRVLDLAHRQRLCLEPLEDRTLLTAGVLDPTFGTSGIVITSFPPATEATADAVAVQPDGKILAAGESGGNDFFVARYNSDGSLDGSFATGGRLALPLPDESAENDVCLALQPDGKILVGDGLLLKPQFVLFRLLANGAPDPSFGSAGEVQIFMTPIDGNRLALQPDGKIVVSGFGSLTRLNPDGSPDPGFGSIGTVTLSAMGGTGLALQPDGKILRAVTSGVQRINADGSIDVSFGNAGVAAVPGAPSNSILNVRIALQANDRIVVADEFTSPNNEQMNLSRLNTNGTVDVTFGMNGLASADFGPLTIPFVFAITVQADGRIVAAGTAAQALALARFTPNGELDATFGNGGGVITPISPNGAEIMSLAVQSDGKIVAAGGVASPGPSFALARYSADAPITDPNQRFLSQVYLDLLQRPIDPSGLATWTAALAAGATPTQVVGAIETSQEYRTLEVEYLYGFLLNRPVDSTGLTAWVNFLKQGGTMQQLEAQILGSDEYFSNRGGGTNASFLQKVYEDILQRPIDSSGAQAWGQILANGGARSAVAGAILTSPESDTNVVEALYQTFLRRAADPSGLKTFTTALQNGVSLEALIAVVAGSQEYFNRF